MYYVRFQPSYPSDGSYWPKVLEPQAIKPSVWCSAWRLLTLKIAGTVLSNERFALAQTDEIVLTTYLFFAIDQNLPHLYRLQNLQNFTLPVSVVYTIQCIKYIQGILQFHSAITRGRVSPLGIPALPLPVRPSIVWLFSKLTVLSAEI